MQNKEARLAALADPARRQTVQRYEGHIDGGGRMVQREEVTLKRTQAEFGGASLIITADHNGRDGTDLAKFTDFPRQAVVDAITEALELPKNWKGYERLTMTLTNGDQPLNCELTVVGARGRITEARMLEPHEKANLSVDLIDLPLVQGKLPEYEPTGVRIALWWEGPHEERSVTVHSLRLIGAPDGKIKAPVDRWGQRVNAEWPTKIHSDEALRGAMEKENAYLAKLAPLPQRSHFSGWMKGPQFEGTGFFRVTQDDQGRWWYADPEGYPFWSVGATGVRYSDNTIIDNRDYLFEAIPSQREAPEGAYERETWRGIESLTFKMYYYNVLRKYGSIEKWRDQILKRYAVWGYNTIANWSTREMLDQELIPHVRTLNTKGPQQCFINGTIYDVFDPQWRQWFEEQLEHNARPHKDNPWIIGYFVDNEKNWRNMGLLHAAPRAAIRNEWLKLAQSRYDTVTAFNDAMGTSCADWDAVKALSEEALPAQGAGQQLREALEEGYTERYFSLVTSLLKQYDPNHLYLGCRFTRMPLREPLVRIAGKYSDVVSVNCYSLLPERDTFETWHRWSGRPIQIGEHQLSAFGARQLPQLWTTFTPEERRRNYPLFEKTFAQMPFSVGSHWFQYADQMITGRPSNGENQIIGVVDITDQPHPEMLEAIREIGENVYQWHMQAG